METLQLLLQGLSTALTPINVLMATIGVILGAIIGALPGIGSATGVAVLLPITYGMNPITAVILLAGVYYGAMYGGSISAILINAPGDPAAVMTSLDGHPLAQQGRAGHAFTVASGSSFIGGTFGIIMLTFLAPSLARWALNFGPPEYFALMVMGLTTLTGLAGDSPIKGLISTFFGLMLAMVGLDIVSGVGRYTYGVLELLDGIDFLPVVMGLFGVAEVLAGMESMAYGEMITSKVGLRNMFPKAREFFSLWKAWIRGAIIGFAIGVLPGAGATMASFMAYATEKNFSRTPQRFGKGHLPGVAAPEAANNAASAGAMVPLLALGIPGSATTAVLLGAFMMYGLRPGPLLFAQRPDFAWAAIASMYVGNILLAIMIIVFIPLFVRVLLTPKNILMPLIIVITLVGTFSIRNNLIDVWIALIFGVIGYLFKKLKIPAAPLVLALVLGPLAEKTMRLSLMLSQGSFSIFFTRPIALVLMIAAFAALVIPIIIQLRASRSVKNGS